MTIVISCAEWFVIGLNCQKAFQFLDANYVQFGVESQNWKVQRYFRTKIRELINEILRMLQESDRNQDNYEDIFVRAASEFKYIYSWIEILQMQKAAQTDLPRDVVYEIDPSETLIRY
jgi:hypothetical protein